LNDEFAQDLGDYRTMDELRAAVKKSLFDQRQEEAQREAKDKIVEYLVDQHEFPVPEAFINRQVENRVEQRLRTLAQQGVDPKSFKLDWDSIRDAQKEPATREVKASLLLGRVAEREAIGATRDEVDKHVERLARQQREAFAPLRLRLEKDGSLNRIASHIQTEKTLDFLFEHATKTA
jgi:trigger factor